MDSFNLDAIDRRDRIDKDVQAVSLDEPGQVLLVAEGGRGGIGNQNMAGTATRRQKSLVSEREIMLVKESILFALYLLSPYIEFDSQCQNCQATRVSQDPSYWS